jgi:hypothetical protein
MPNKHFCQGPHCHTQATSDRFLKSKGIIRGRYAYARIDENQWYSESDKYFCSQTCKLQWLNENMQNIEQGIPVPFITHRRITEGYQKVSDTNGYYSYNRIQKIRVDNDNDNDRIIP